MANPLVLWRNRVTDALFTSTGEWQAPLTNLATDFLTEVARSADLDPAKTQFDVDLRVVRTIRGLVLLNTNLSILARYRLRASSDPTFPDNDDVIRYDSGWMEMFRRLYSSMALPWAAPNWWFGRPSEEDLAGFPRNLIHVLPENVDARYWRVEIDDTSNVTGYIDLGRLLIAGGSQASQGYARGARSGIETATVKRRSRGGVLFTRHRAPVRVRAFELPWLPRQEAIERWWEIQRQMGVDGELFVIPDPDDDINLARHAFRGTLRNITPLIEVQTNHASITLEIEES